MNSIIFNPLEEYEGKFKSLHLENTQKYFDELATKADINIAENRRTVEKLNHFKDSLKKLKKKMNLWRFLRVLMIITVLLIPLVLLKITPKIKDLRKQIAEAKKNAEELLDLAYGQTAPLNSLFSDNDALKIIEQTIPSLKFSTCLSAQQEANMRINFDYSEIDNDEISTTDLLAGEYNGNPFVFDTKLVHKMGQEMYHGYKTIFWTETYRDSDGKTRTVTRSETLHASVIKPKPTYSTGVALYYCTQGGPDLSFSRDATHLDRKSDREIEKYVKKGEKKLKKRTDAAIKKNQDFVSMSNTDFEVLFDALDRNDEVQFRTLFTPLAQTNMVDLIRSTVGYGDDFNFIKRKRTNEIVSKHSQGRELRLTSDKYLSYSYDVIKNSFLELNCRFFKSIYFDFAPVWAIPMYQDRPVHSLEPIPSYIQKYSDKECEALANVISAYETVHPESKTQAILKSRFISSTDGVDKIRISAYSYDIIPRVDFIPVHGGDGRWHNVPVPWDDYIPLAAENDFYVSGEECSDNRVLLAERNGMYIYK